MLETVQRFEKWNTDWTKKTRTHRKVCYLRLLSRPATFCVRPVWSGISNSYPKLCNDLSFAANFNLSVAVNDGFYFLKAKCWKRKWYVFCIFTSHKNSLLLHNFRSQHPYGQSIFFWKLPFCEDFWNRSVYIGFKKYNWKSVLFNHLHVFVNSVSKSYREKLGSCRNSLNEKPWNTTRLILRILIFYPRNYPICMRNLMQESNCSVSATKSSLILVAMPCFARR